MQRCASPTLCAVFGLLFALKTIVKRSRREWMRDDDIEIVSLKLAV